MRSRKVPLVTFLGASLLLAACGSSSAVSSKVTSTTASSSSSIHGSVTLAAVAPFSGSSAFIGLIQNAAIYTAANEINAAGGILGHKLVPQDVNTTGDPADALPAVDKFLATTSNILGVLGPGTNSGPLLAPIFNSHHIVMMSQAGETSFDHNTLPYFWRPVPSDAATGVGMAIYAHSKGWTTAATVFGSDAGSQGDLPGVVAGAKAEGIKIVASENVQLDQPSYASEVARVIAAHPQVIFSEADPTTSATFFSELIHQTSQPIHVVFTPVILESSYLNAVRGAVGASRFASLYRTVSNEPTATGPAGKDYNSWLLKSGANVPKPQQWVNNPHSMAVYSMSMIMALAATEAHSISGAAYNKDIMSVTSAGSGKTPVYTYAQGVKLINEGKKIQYIGTFGPLSFNQYHNAGDAEVVETYSTSGSWQTLHTISAAKVNAVNVSGVQ
ncbi:MAG: ABC transporter substrate-binding protein [Actinomycetota bacterium]|nr:ABC transporter substrate-binding protein [Actinomycetota bacterium]